MGRKLNKAKVLGVLAGGDFPLQKLQDWAISADIVIAADGGANLLETIGVVPNVTVGDLDSISQTVKEKQLELVYIEDQNSSDCDKLLHLAKQRDLLEVTLIGVEGNLLDHMISSLLSSAKSGLSVRFVLRQGIAYIINGPLEDSYDFPLGARLSLLPISDCENVDLTGVKWPLFNSTLSPLGLTSLSNKTTGQVKLRIGRGSAALFLSHPELQLVHW